MRISNNDLIVNEIYNMSHARKGKALVKILSFDVVWITVEIVEGELTGMNDYWDVGDTLTIRKDLCIFYEKD